MSITSKITCGFLVTALCLGLAGCGSKTSVVENNFALQQRLITDNKLSNKDNSALIANIENSGADVIQLADQLQIILPTDAFFITQGKQLNPNKAGTLSSITQLIKQYGDTTITINGYTDNIYSSAHSKSLSAIQARIISDNLWAYGIKKSAMKIHGYGAKHSIADNINSQGRSFNRRIEIHINLANANPGPVITSK